MLTNREILVEDEDPDIICARTREFWLEKRAAKIGRKSVAWFRRIHQHKRPTIEDTVADRLERVFETEFAFYKWNVGTVLCVYCNSALTKRTVTREHVIPQSAWKDERTAPAGDPDAQGNVMPCCADCNHAKADDSLLVFLMNRSRLTREGLQEAV